MENKKPYIEIHYDGEGIMSGFSTWHKINKKWVHIIQEFKNKDIIYFTDGKKEE